MVNSHPVKPVVIVRRRRRRRRRRKGSGVAKSVRPVSILPSMLHLRPRVILPVLHPRLRVRIPCVRLMSIVGVRYFLKLVRF